MRAPLALALAGTLTTVLMRGALAMASPAVVLELLDRGRCPGCDLTRADLVQAQLTNANLEAAKLKGANLSGAQLDGVNLSRSDLSFASLNGASLRGANLKGAVLDGTDFRGSDLNGAQIEREALASAHWFGAKGINPAHLNYSAIHNAGSTAVKRGQFAEAERWFSEAIRRNPKAAISWLARGISRSEQGDQVKAAQDIAYASKLYAEMGDTQRAIELSQASKTLLMPAPKSKTGNGAGSALLSGAASALKILAPLALKTLMPLSL